MKITTKIAFCKLREFDALIVEYLYKKEATGGQ